MKKSKYFKDGYTNPARCSETITSLNISDIDNPKFKWVKEMSEGVKQALTDKQNGNYNFNNY